MKLVMAVVNAIDSKDVMKNLMRDGFQVTQLASSGGFLKAKNVTLMCGVSDERADKCVETIEKTCKSQKYSAKNLTPEAFSVFSGGIGFNPQQKSSESRAEEIVIKGATVFVLNIEKFAKL